MSDYTRNLVFVVAARVAAANSDCVTGFAVTCDQKGYVVSFEGRSEATLYRSQTSVSEVDISTATNPEPFVRHMLRLRVEALRRRVNGK